MRKEQVHSFATGNWQNTLKKTLYTTTVCMSPPLAHPPPSGGCARCVMCWHIGFLSVLQPCNTNMNTWTKSIILYVVSHQGWQCSAFKSLGASLHYLCDSPPKDKHVVDLTFNALPTDYSLIRQDISQIKFFTINIIILVVVVIIEKPMYLYSPTSRNNGCPIL